MTYEIHITLPPTDAVVATNIAKDLLWKTSKIDGDPVMGDKIFFYLTAHTMTMQEAVDRMDTAVIALRAAGCSVLREKVEHIVYDRRYNK